MGLRDASASKKKKNKGRFGFEKVIDTSPKSCLYPKSHIG